MDTIKNKIYAPDTKGNIINKFIIVEEWAYHGRHWIDRVDQPDVEKAKFCVKRLEDELTMLKEYLGVER